MSQFWRDLLNAIPWPIPIMHRPARKQARSWRGVNVCMKVATITKIQPIAIPNLRPRKSAQGPPRKKPPKIAPTVYAVLIEPIVFALGWFIHASQFLEPWTELKTDAS